MTRKFKDFGDIGVVNAADIEPVSFALLGEEFQCRPAIPGSTLLNFVAKADGANTSAAAGSIFAFFESALTPDDYIRFRALVDSPERIVPMDTLSEIVGWLVEQYTERPTKRQSPSPDGQSPTGLTSEEPASLLPVQEALPIG
jgi:hypothetical protein